MLNIGYNLNRAHIAWYYIDQIFTNGNANTPKHIKNDKEMLSHHYIRPVIEQEIYQDILDSLHFRQLETGKSRMSKSN